MHEIEMHEASQEFARCWQAAGRHLEKCTGDYPPQWLKADLSPPLLEHLSFRLGNQLFFIRLEDVDGRLAVPGHRDGLMMIAEGCQGHPCIMPMRRSRTEWAPALPGWGLIALTTGASIDPLGLVSDALIEMTEWEMQDLAVQIVRDQLVAQGRQIMSSQGNPNVDPALWFVGDAGPEWVVVRAYRATERGPPRPANWPSIVASCSRLSSRGHFVPVGIQNAKEPDKPLWRGYEMSIPLAVFPATAQQRQQPQP